jgi:ubiquinone biosynthesis monooxygenase Coq7
MKQSFDRKKVSKPLLPGDRLPGDGVQSLQQDKTLESFIRVNQAGEYGAKRIYQGQLRVLKGMRSASIGVHNNGDNTVDKISHMADQEEVHLAKFTAMIKENQLRPTVLMPLWHIAGYALGMGTALLGSKAAMACTVAVEEVIDEHYANQRNVLAVYRAERSGESAFLKELEETVEKFRLEELEHRDTAVEEGALNSPFYGAIKFGVSRASRLAIWLSERV